MGTGVSSMSKIWKYEVEIKDHFEVVMPVLSKPLCVMVQYGTPQMWVQVTPSDQTSIRRFRLAGTGHEINEYEGTHKYIGSFQLANGDLVFHLFEITTR
jgi:hypothetical protein